MRMLGSASSMLAIRAALVQSCDRNVLHAVENEELFVQTAFLTLPRIQVGLLSPYIARRTLSHSQDEEGHLSKPEAEHGIR